VHETAEEMVVHLRARGEVSDGQVIVDSRLKEEHDAKDSYKNWKRWTSARRNSSTSSSSSSRPCSIAPNNVPRSAVVVAQSGGQSSGNKDLRDNAPREPYH